jgi:hypothetical protein
MPLMQYFRHNRGSFFFIQMIVKEGSFLKASSLERYWRFRIWQLRQLAKLTDFAVLTFIIVFWRRDYEND